MTLIKNKKKKRLFCQLKKAAFHKTCFRCTTCNVQLNVGNFESYNKELYCKIHVKDAIPKSNEKYFLSPLKKQTDTEEVLESKNEIKHEELLKVESKIESLKPITQSNNEDDEFEKKREQKRKEKEEEESISKKKEESKKKKKNPKLNN